MNYQQNKIKQLLLNVHFEGGGKINQHNTEFFLNMLIFHINAGCTKVDYNSHLKKTISVISLAAAKT